MFCCVLRTEKAQHWWLVNVEQQNDGHGFSPLQHSHYQLLITWKCEGRRGLFFLADLVWGEDLSFIHFLSSSLPLFGLLPSHAFFSFPLLSERRRVNVFTDGINFPCCVLPAVFSAKPKIPLTLLVETVQSHILQTPLCLHPAPQ